MRTDGEQNTTTRPRLVVALVLLEETSAKKQRLNHVERMKFIMQNIFWLLDSWHQNKNDQI